MQMAILRSTKFIIVSLKAPPFGLVETLIDSTANVVPLFGGEHVMVSNGRQDVISDDLARTPSVNANKINCGMSGILAVGHWTQSYQTQPNFSMLIEPFGPCSSTAHPTFTAQQRI